MRIQFGLSKMCSRCGDEKPKDEFPAIGRQCRPCMAQRSRDWYAANRERAKATSREYYRANREQCVETSKEYYRANSERLNKANQTYRKDNQDRRAHWSRHNHLRRKYGLTIADYEAMLEQQGGGCAICQRAPADGEHRLAVDHCHDSGKVRGLLCRECNLAIGYLRDEPDFCVAAARYLDAAK